VTEYWAATWTHWNNKSYFCVNLYRHMVHDQLLEVWFPKEVYANKRDRSNCLRRLRYKGLLVEKVRVVKA